MHDASLPRILIVDDVFGRAHDGARNEDRANLCSELGLVDVTGDESHFGGAQAIVAPIAEVVFSRGQVPARANVGDRIVNDVEGTLAAVASGWNGESSSVKRWALVCLDLCFHTGAVTAESNRRNRGMPTGTPGDEEPLRYFGLELLGAIHERFPDLPVIMLSSKPREQVSRDFSRMGALAFLPRVGDRGAEMLQEYLFRHGLLPDPEGEIVGRSRALLLSLRAARRASDSRLNVLIRGDRGTGKELMARYLWRLARKGGERALVPVDSGALDRHLYASTLFGHRRGAFTGAEKDREGEIVRAHGGDLFLDEIGNMPPDVQSGLLRVIEYRKVTPVGAGASVEVDVRFLSATNEEIEGRAATGGFRQDLLDRLREAGTIFLPPLRERREDIPLLIEHILRLAELQQASTLRRTVEPEAMELLVSYDWPGNVRELRRAIWSAVANSDVEHVVPIHLPAEVRLGSNVDDVVKPKQFASGSPNVNHSAEGQQQPPQVLVAPSDGRMLDVAALAGSLTRLKAEETRAAAALLRAALLATRRSSLARPEGELLIHPALKLLTGNPTLTASQAADVIKRLLGSASEGATELLADPVLHEAHEIALRLRPRVARRKPKD